MIGITIKPTIGIGDALQFSSLPENYFRATGKRLLDLSRPWFFDHNPFVSRETEVPEKTIEMWNFPNHYEWPDLRKKDIYLGQPGERKTGVYLSNAEIWAGVFKVPVVLNRPRLYMYEDFPFHQRQKIILHTHGRSHGTMPAHVIEHVLSKYNRMSLYHVGEGNIYGIPQLETPTLWDLARELSRARMVIGMDSGPAWIASCYPDVIVKKLRTKPNPPELLEDWVPLERLNIHSHWDSREIMAYNVTERDIGFTWSYTKI